MAFTITSPAFVPDGPIPKKYTCDLDDVSPALAWSGAPPGTRSFALIMQDPDAPDPAAPKRVYVHWVLYDLPPDCEGLPEAVTQASLPVGTREGTNDWNRTGYGGPCPPIGRHRYYFRLFALGRMLGDLREPRRADLEGIMGRHVLAKAELMGTYGPRQDAR